jgi:hypothetical protein
MTHSGYARVAPIIALSTLLAVPVARAQAGTQMIADFEGGKTETVTGLALPVISDEQVGGPSTATLTLVSPGAQSSRAGLRISFEIADGYSNPFSSVWALLGEKGLATDLSAFKGLRFYARSSSGAYSAGMNQFGSRLRPTAVFEVKPEWTLVELPFEGFRTGPPGGPPTPFVPKDMTAIGFSIAPNLRGRFELDIDQVEFYK